MAKSTKSYEERMLEMEKKEQESLEKAKRYAAQKKELLKRKKAEESKKRTHRLCQVGGAVESVLGAPIEEEDIPKLIGFLKKQEANGKFFSKAMQKETHTLNFRRGSRCPKIAFWQSKFPKNGSLSINYCDIFEKIV